MSSSNEFSSSISLYARPSDSFVFSVLDESTNNQLSSELMSLIQSRIDNDSLDTNENENNIRNNNSSTNEWSVHNPEVRTIFQELTSKLKDIESVYKRTETVEHTVVPTAETLDNAKKLQESVAFFKDKINNYFNKFIQTQTQCEREEAFLSQCSSIIDLIKSPSLEEEDFNECANDICKSLKTFTSKIKDKLSQNRKNRDVFWSHYKEFRDTCKLVREVQSDIICQICMEREVGMVLNCGHCFCTECATRCSSCPNCRTSVTRKLKLYL